MTRVRLTVNGTAVDVDVEPRHTLADTLRGRLHLTGVHLGCEHGVCGMCTVLVDGRAVRSCLLFTVQLDGADVLTVEALGRPADLHPLQQAFHANHALQCGFCTPAFLLSAYELLRDNPTLDGVDLPVELSGVLCRCTGYRQILDAVRDVAAAYPDGVPPPAAVGHNPALAVQHTVPSAATPAPPPVSAIPPASPGPVATPGQEPSAVTVEMAGRVHHPVDAVWDLLADVPRAASCLPGVTLHRRTDSPDHAGRLTVAAGPVRLTATGTVTVLDTDPAGRTLRVAVRRTRRGTRADITVRAVPDGPHTTLHATVRLAHLGPAARLGRFAASDLTWALFRRFVRNIDATLGAHPPGSTSAGSDPSGWSGSGRPGGPAASPRSPGRRTLR